MTVVRVMIGCMDGTLTRGRGSKYPKFCGRHLSMALKGTERVSEIRETWRRHFQAAFSLSLFFLLHPHKLHFRSPILGHFSTLLSELRSLRKHVPISEKHSSIYQTRSISFETWGTQLTINKPLARFDLNMRMIRRLSNGEKEGISSEH